MCLDWLGIPSEIEGEPPPYNVPQALSVERWAFSVERRTIKELPAVFYHITVLMVTNPRGDWARGAK